jgi:polyhydroxybutyrate depolymerase
MKGLMTGIAFLLVTVGVSSCLNRQQIPDRFAENPLGSGPLTSGRSLSPGDYERTLSNWPGRPYDLHVPAGYDPSRPAPVLLVIHGTGGSGKATAKGSCPDGDEENPKCFGKLADRENFIVVYPNGTTDPEKPRLSRTWNAGGGKNGYVCIQGYACAHNIDDVRYFRDLLDDLGRIASVDAARVFATGISNGAVMSHRLACELSERIAAIAPISGVNQFAAVAPCGPSRAVAVVAFHGTADQIAPYNGGQGKHDTGIRLSVPKTIADWVARNKCSANPRHENLPTTVSDGTAVSRDTYSSCSDGAEVMIYTIDGGGHTWPDGQPYAPEFLIGKTTHNINANQVMWEFFKNHPRM